MRRTNGVEVEVESPTVGLFTRIPTNLPDKKAGRALTVASNVRAERGVLSAAPGYEKIIPSPTNLDSPANLIFQSDITNINVETQTTPIIGTGGKLFVLRRRARLQLCGFDRCQLRAAFVGDSGLPGANVQSVADLIRSWNVDVLCHTGDLVYSSAVPEDALLDYEQCVGQYFYQWMGGYRGYYGTGPERNSFFPVLGNHDWDEPIAEYYDFFNIPGNERSYSLRRGPVECFAFSADPREPDGLTAGSIQGQRLRAALAASDRPWRVVWLHQPPSTSDAAHYPGNPDLMWIAQHPLVSAVICGHSHNMEVIEIPGCAPILICGTGGAELRGFHNPPVDHSSFRHSGEYGAIRLDADTTSAVFGFYTTGSKTPLREVVLGTPKLDSGVCYVGDAAAQVVSLKVVPPSASAERGYSWPFEAWATLWDGNVVNVTDRSVWTSSDAGIATVSANSGVATGQQPGTVTISATYSGMTASASFHVLLSCLDKPIDAVLVIERSASMLAAAGGDASRLSAAKDAADLFIDSLTTADQVGLVSFAGTFATQVEDATLDSPLTNSFPGVKDRVSVLIGAGDSGAAAGLRLAQSELASTRARTDSAKMVVLVVDGPSDVIAPGGDSSSYSAAATAALTGLSTEATLLKETGATLVIVGYDIPAAYETALRTIASAGYYFGVSDPVELKQTLAGLANLFCLYDGSYYYYYYDSPPIGGGLVSPQLDYFGFINWNVIDGVVDLCGMGTNGVSLYDLQPGNGLYVDLVGTNPENSIGKKSFEGTMETKASFPVTAGKTYRLSVDLGGNKRIEMYEFKVHITFGTLVDQWVTINTPYGPFKTYSFEFTPTSNSSGKIRLQHGSGPEFRPSTVGTYMDNVKLENVTDASTVFADNFDGENPVP